MTPTNPLFDTAARIVEIDGRWFITAGNPGFNTRQNQTGYDSRKAAEKAGARVAKRAVR